MTDFTENRTGQRPGLTIRPLAAGTLAAGTVAFALMLAGCHAVKEPAEKADRVDPVGSVESKTAGAGEDATRITAEADGPVEGQSTAPAKTPLQDVTESELVQIREEIPEARKKEQVAGAMSQQMLAPRTATLMAKPAPGFPHVPPLASNQGFPQDRENYAQFDENPLKLVAEHPVSTFSIDVDTGSYSNVRRFLNQGQLPRQDAVRVEELINYFNYDYAGPDNKEQPFAIHTEMAPSPWRNDAVLLHVGLKGYELPVSQLPPANLVFLIDVSGSMNSPAKIGLLKQGFRLLVKQLRAQDTISIAVYAGASGTVLEPTSGDQKGKILAAIDQLQAGGSTNGAAGINLAYQLAQASQKPDGINRVILATDGDFNVGTVNFEALKDMVERRRETGVSLTTLGFGTGNYNDHLMEQLADAGNGNYSYIDNLQEARKVLVEELGSTLQTIAKDVKIQIEFNPAQVLSYRLVGYENRMLKREDFNNDKVDAGEIGAGHTVTAIYELELAGHANPMVDPLRYGNSNSNIAPETNTENKAAELGFLKLRYKLPTESRSRLITQSLDKQQILQAMDSTSDNFRFAAAVAGFGQLLKGGTYTGKMSYDDIVALGMNARGNDPWGYRSEFINLVRLAKQLAQ